MEVEDDDKMSKITLEMGSGEPNCRRMSVWSVRNTLNDVSEIQLFCDFRVFFFGISQNRWTFKNHDL